MAQNGISVFQDYVSELPLRGHAWLKEVLDWDNNDLTVIATYLSDWEVKLAVPFNFTKHEIDDLKDKHNNPILLRY